MLTVDSFDGGESCRQESFNSRFNPVNLFSKILAVNTKRRETGRLFTVAGGMGAEGPLGKAVGFVFVTLVVILVIIWAVEP